jgi:hypothetical protein
MNWINENVVEILSVLFGTGGIGFAIISRILDRKKYQQEVRQASNEADKQADEFWKQRYDVLNAEVQNKDAWWRERYDNLYQELQNERKLSNEIIKNFRTELNEIREDYERQHAVDSEKYEALMKKYMEYQAEVETKNREQMSRISQLEDLVTEYERKIKRNEDK